MSITICRLCKQKHASTAEEAFNGEGARIAGGRWNPVGVSVVYTSASLALSSLEYLVHLVNLSADEIAGLQLVAINAEIPDSIIFDSFDTSQLPFDWKAYPAPKSLAQMGEEWVINGKTAVLSVPSVVVPQERNYILNPNHHDFEYIKLSSPEPFNLDPRLWTARKRSNSSE